MVSLPGTGLCQSSDADTRSAGSQPRIQRRLGRQVGIVAFEPPSNQPATPRPPDHDRDTFVRRRLLTVVAVRENYRYCARNQTLSWLLSLSWDGVAGGTEPWRLPAGRTSLAIKVGGAQPGDVRRAETEGMRRAIPLRATHAGATPRTFWAQQRSEVQSPIGTRPCRDERRGLEWPGLVEGPCRPGRPRGPFHGHRVRSAPRPVAQRRTGRAHRRPAPPSVGHPAGRH